MKRFTLLASVSLIFLLSGKTGFGQQDPQYTHYMFQSLNYNPAYSGFNPKNICANFLFHSQWTGFEGPEGGKAPRTQLFNISAPFQSKYIHGAGLNAFRDAQGFEQTVAISANGAYRRSFAFGQISVGLSAGIVQKSIDPEVIVIDPDDPVVQQINQQGGISKVIPDIGLGAYFNTNKYYAGISYLHLTRGDLGWSSKGGSNYLRHLYLTGGYYYDLNQNIQIRPSALIKADRAKIQYDVNVMGLLQEKYWAALSYRGGDAITALLGMKLTPKLKIGYSYDLPVTGGDIKKSGTHEVYIGYCFKFKPKFKKKYERVIWTPRFL